MNLKRLRQMPKSEISHRLREQVRRRLDNVRFRMSAGLDDDAEFDALIENHGSSLKSYLSSGPARRFYPSTQDREGITKLFLRHPDWRDRVIQEAVALCEHRFSFFDRSDIPLGATIDWHRDPISGFRWPKRYWTEYDLVKTPPADAKSIHELNRHQHLPRLAKAFFLTNDERYAGEAVAQMLGWIDQNPKWSGVNWQSSLEIALRSISWLWTIFLLLPSDSLNEEALRRICRSLFAQLDQVYRYPSVYTSPNTHLIGEASALLMAGMLFLELDRAQEWHDFGLLTLADKMNRQVPDDGVYCELSSYYHCYAADFYLHVLALARRNGTQLPESMWAGLSRMLEFIMHLTRPDGTIPLIGDDDGGRVMAFALRNYRSYRDGLCSGALLFDRGDFKCSAGDFKEETLWLLGADAWSAFDSLAPQHPSELYRPFRESGYFVQRSGWQPHDTQVIFDCGGLGLLGGGHGHADALSFTLFTGGHEFLIDPGTSVYNCAPEWRRFFRSTSAHNSVVVDNADQSESGGTFNWKYKAPVRLRQEFSLPEIEYIDGEHDGYTRFSKQITHRRRLVYIKPNYWIVLDELSGRGEHDFDVLYHFAPDTQLTVLCDEKRGELDCRARIENAGLQLFMYASEPIRAEAICGQNNPIQGWSSQGYGERRPSPVLQASIHGNAPVSMMSFLVPGNRALNTRRFKANTNTAIASTIRDGDYDDVAVMAVQDGDLHLIDSVMRGEFFWMRMENGTLKRLVAVNAHSFSYAGENIFDSKEALPYVQVHFWENGILIERGGHERKVYVRDLRDRQFQRN